MYSKEKKPAQIKMIIAMAEKIALMPSTAKQIGSDAVRLKSVKSVPYCVSSVATTSIPVIAKQIPAVISKCLLSAISFLTRRYTPARTGKTMDKRIKYMSSPPYANMARPCSIMSTIGWELTPNKMFNIMKNISTMLYCFLSLKVTLG